MPTVERPVRCLMIGLTRAVGIVALVGATLIGFAVTGADPPAAAGGPSGPLTFAEVEAFWVAAGGPASLAAIAAAITGAESSFEPGAIQQGQPYGTTGWGLWQITPGDSESQFCEDFQILDPWNSAESAVAKYVGAGDTFEPWTTYTDGAYLHYLPVNPPPPAQESNPGQYLPIGSAPSGTHNDSAPGSTCGPPMSHSKPSLTASPSALPGVGGKVSLSASATNATHYSYSVTPPIPRWDPGSKAAANVVVPANNGDNGKAYTFGVAARGPDGTTSPATTVVTMPWPQNVTVGPGTNGSLEEVFKVDSSGIVWHQWEYPGGTWSGWVSLGDIAVSNSVAWAPGSNGSLEELFAVDSSGNVWHQWEYPGGTWSGWQSLGGVNFVGDVTYAPGSHGSIGEVFATDSHGHVWESWEYTNGSWSRWTTLPGRGSVAGQVTEAPGYNGSLQQLFAINSRGDAVYRWEKPNGSWTDWYSLGGGNLISNVTVAPIKVNGTVANIFAANMAGQVDYAWQYPNGSWSGWNTFGGGGGIVSNPTYAPGSNGSSAELFASNAGGSVVYQWEASNGSWSGWSTLGSAICVQRHSDVRAGHEWCRARGFRRRGIWHRVSRL